MLPFAADTILIFIAASLTKPLQPTLDGYAARTHTVILRESGATLEHVRKITELHRTPDLLLLADADVFPQFLVPKYSSWFAEFARNRMVVAYTDRSKHAGDINAGNWTKILAGSDVEIGRTDPNLAPVGYRTLLMFDLGDAKQASYYATASVQVRGTTPGTKATFKGEPILYGATIPAAAPHAKAAVDLDRYLTSPAIVAQLRAAHVDMLEHPIVVGRGAP